MMHCKTLYLLISFAFLKRVVSTDFKMRRSLQKPIVWSSAGNSALDLQQRVSVSERATRTRFTDKIPSGLLPIYSALALDGASTGFLIPLLPFYVQSFKPSAGQMSAMISATYAAQAVGTLVMGRVSDRFGRKIAAQLSILIGFISYLALSRSVSLKGVLIARITAGLSGGLISILQTCILDSTKASSSNDLDQTTLLGWAQATYCAGFTLGPPLFMLMSGISSRKKILISSLFPFISFFVMSRSDYPSSAVVKQNDGFSLISDPRRRSFMEKLPIYITSFALMFAFSTEGLYPLLLKERFSAGENSLASFVFSASICIFFAQAFFIPKLVHTIGQQKMQYLGNLLLSLGLLGIGFTKSIYAHFPMFLLHVVGFSLADTANILLLSELAGPVGRGQDISTNQAIQAVAKILSPLISGYIQSREVVWLSLPTLIAPFALNSMFPLLATMTSLSLDRVTAIY